jgi:hypothetical protein
MSGKSTSDDRPHDTRNQEHNAHETLIYGPFAQRYDVQSQNNTPREDPCRAESRDRTTDDECGRVLRDAADEGPQFEDRDACVPADIVDGVKDVGYLGNSCGDDCAVLTIELAEVPREFIVENRVRTHQRYKKQGEKQSDHNYNDLSRWRIHFSFVIFFCCWYWHLPCFLRLWLLCCDCTLHIMGWLLNRIVVLSRIV